MGLAEAQVGRGGRRIAEGDVGFGQAQMVFGNVRVLLHQPLEQIQADLGVAVVQQGGGSHDVQGTEQPGGRPAAEVGIELPAAAGAALDLRNQIGGQEALLLHQPAHDRGAREQRWGGIFRIRAHDVVCVLAVRGRVLARRNQGFERVRYGQRVLPIAGGGELGMHDTPPARTARIEAETRCRQ